MAKYICGYKIDLKFLYIFGNLRTYYGNDRYCEYGNSWILFQLRVSEMVMVRKEMYVYGKESMQKWNAD